MHPLANAVIVCWLIFWAYWLVMSFGSKRNVSARVNRFVGFRLVLIVAAVWILRSLNSNSRSTNNYYLTKNETVMVVGFIVFIMGLLVAIWARVFLGKNWGMPMSEKQEPELVTTGPYRYIRHPIYTGILLATVGSIFAGGLFWILVLAFVAPYFIYSAVVEEKLMLKQFPKVYPEYKNRTKMLVPFIF